MSTDKKEKVQVKERLNTAVEEPIKEPTTEVQAGDNFFRNQVYQQSLEANSGWTILMQALVGQASKTIANTEDGKPSVDMEALEKLMSLSKTMQLDTLDIMKAMRDNSE